MKKKGQRRTRKVNRKRIGKDLSLLRNWRYKVGRVELGNIRLSFVLLGVTLLASSLE